MREITFYTILPTLKSALPQIGVHELTRDNNIVNESD